MIKKISIWTVFLIPVLSYCAVVFMSAVNLPFYDDITQIVWILNEFVEPKMDSTFVTVADTPDKLHALFYPNAGHIPLGTRLFSLLQYYMMGGVNFQTSVWAANTGWVLTMLLFVHWSIKNSRLSLAYMLPVSFFMMSIVHWEAMSMALGGWQMFWGASLFPLLILIAATSGSPFLASALYFGALFESGGSLCLYPLVLGFFIFKKQWRNFLVFFLLGGIQVGIFLHFNPISSNLQTSTTAGFTEIVKYILAFVGNIYSVGVYDLQPLSTLQIVTGLILIVAGSFCLLNVRNNYLPKLLLVYILILAGMAVYKRPGLWVVSRYALFSLLAVSCIYYMLLQYIQEKHNEKAATIFSIATACVAIGIWAWSLYYCTQPLRQDRKDRVLALQQYINTGDASGLMWNGPWASEILSEAKRLDIYDFEVGRDLEP